MAIILTETFESLTNSDLIRTAARQLGESEAAVSTAISGAGMALLARLSQLSSDAGLMSRVAALIDTRSEGAGMAPAFPAAAPPRVSSLARGTALLNIVYGPRLQGLVAALADHAAISQPSARAAIGYAAPLVLKALGERLCEAEPALSGLAPTAKQLADVLTSEREAIAADAPPALMASLVAALGRPAAPARPASAGGTMTAHTGYAAGGVSAQAGLEEAGLSMPAMLGALVVLALLWWLFLPGLYAPYALHVTPPAERLGRTETRVPLTGPDTAAGGTFSSPTSTTPSSRTAPAAVTTLLRFIKRTLPGNKQIDFIENGIEGRLIQLIENRGLALERNQWFEFDRLNFQTGSANLTSESRAQVQNIADILSSYPAVRVRIGGYTDNVGDAGANQRLSEARAQRVMTELITLGINALRLEAEGYGEQHPIADNATSEGRALNRRIAVRVLHR